MRLGLTLILILSASMSGIVFANPPTRCPCFNEMFVAGACDRIVRQGGDYQFIVGDPRAVMYCLSEDLDDRWIFDAYTTCGASGCNLGCDVAAVNQGNPLAYPVLNQEPISEEEWLACREDLAVADLLLNE